MRLGFPTRVLSDLTAPVSPELGDIASRQLAEAGVAEIPSAQI